MSLSYGQHPARAMPLQSWPENSRVGTLAVAIIIDTTRPSAPGFPQILYDRDIRRDDNEIIELIIIIIESGIFE